MSLFVRLPYYCINIDKYDFGLHGNHITVEVPHKDNFLTKSPGAVGQVNVHDFTVRRELHVLHDDQGSFHARDRSIVDAGKDLQELLGNQGFMRVLTMRILVFREGPEEFCGSGSVGIHGGQGVLKKNQDPACHV